MKTIWKVLSTEDNREFLAALRKVDSLETANNILLEILPIVAKHDAQHDSDISISSENISVILHGHSSKPIDDSDWSLANELEPLLK